MKTLSFALCSLFMGAVATAAPILWSLPPVTLEGCCIPPLSDQTGTLSGSFVYDWFSNAFSDWNFEVSGFTGPLSLLNETLKPATSTLVAGGPTFLAVASSNSQVALTFGYVTMGGIVEVPLSTFGGHVPVLISDSALFVSFFATSRGTVSSVPEPLAGILVLTGAAVLCLWKGRRRRNT